jgi:hypothetical protein
MAFVGRTRALVERELGGPGALTDSGHVSAVLERLGTPEDLVIEERTRIDRGWVKKRAPSEEEGEAAAAALTGPLNRSLTPRRRPGGDTQPGRGTAPGDPGTGPVTPAEGTPVAGSAGPRRPGLRSVGPRSTSLRGVGPRSAGVQSAPGRGAAVPAAAGCAAPTRPARAPGTRTHHRWARIRQARRRRARIPWAPGRPAPGAPGRSAG